MMVYKLYIIIVKSQVNLLGCNYNIPVLGRGVSLLSSATFQCFTECVDRSQHIHHHSGTVLRAGLDFCSLRFLVAQPTHSPCVEKARAMNEVIATSIELN